MENKRPSNKALLNTSRLQLVAIDERYADRVYKYYERNKQSFEKVMPLPQPNFYSPEFHQQLLREQTAAMQEGKLLKIYLFLETDKEQATIIGDISFNHILRGPLQSCFLGYKLDENHRGKGYMFEALKLLIEFGFKALKLHRIEANIMPFNSKSIELAEKIGFKKEGFSPDYLKINGKWENHLRYAVLKSDFEG